MREISLEKLKEKNQIIDKNVEVRVVRNKVESFFVYPYIYLKSTPEFKKLNFLTKQLGLDMEGLRDYMKRKNYPREVIGLTFGYVSPEYYHKSLSWVGGKDKRTELQFLLNTVIGWIGEDLVKDSIGFEDYYFAGTDEFRDFCYSYQANDDPDMKYLRDGREVNVDISIDSYGNTNKSKVLIFRDVKFERSVSLVKSGVEVENVVVDVKNKKIYKQSFNSKIKILQRGEPYKPWNGGKASIFKFDPHSVQDLKLNQNERVGEITIAA